MPWIDEYLQSRLGDPLDGSADWKRYDCVFCEKRGKTPDRKGHLHVNVTAFRAHCFRCLYSGSIIRMVSDLEGHELTEETLKELRNLTRTKMTEEDFCERIRGILSHQAHTMELSLRRELVEMKLPHEYEPITASPTTWYERRAIHYLWKRKIPLELALERQIGFARTGRYEDMIIFPVTYRKRVVYFTNRAMNDDALSKSRNPKGLELGKSVWLYNYDYVDPTREVTICEGPIDALHTDNSVALMGKEMSKGQFWLLAALNAKAFRVCVDGDAVAHEVRHWARGRYPLANQSISAQLSSLAPVRIWGLPDGEDPASVGGQLDTYGQDASDIVSRVYLTLRGKLPNNHKR